MQLSGAQHTRDLQQTRRYLLEHTKILSGRWRALVCVSVCTTQSQKKEKQLLCPVHIHIYTVCVRYVVCFLIAC